jgi:hypothetical protein
MKERPILFSAPMVRAILDGRKTQTRRVIVERKIGAPSSIKRDGSYIWALFPNSPFPRMEYQLICPFGQPDDRLWVRENGWEPKTPSIDDIANGADTWPRYAYDADGISETNAEDYRDWGWKRRPSIFMPRWASRITLEITAVRVERIQAISERDCVAEGYVTTQLGAGYPTYITTAQEKQRNGWNQLNAKRGYGWETNPWVWVIEFKRVEELQAAA